MRLYKVGGYVRDKALGLEPEDIDYVVTGATNEKMLELGFIPVGKDFPIFIDPKTRSEIALARLGDDFENITIEQDLSRRDLTINAMAIDEDGSIIDPFGGLDDIKNKRLKHIAGSFESDPLRIVRLARFKAKYDGFEIASETIEHCHNLINGGLLDDPQKDRLYREFSKGILLPEPQKFIDALSEVGALKVLFPVIEKMKGVPQNPVYHAEGCVYTHTLMVLQKSAYLSARLAPEDKIAVRMAALFHDVGKTTTPDELLYDANGKVLGKHHGHEDKEVVLPLLKEIKQKMTMPKAVYYNIEHTAINHLRVHRVKQTKGASFVNMANSMGLASKTNNGRNMQVVDNFLLACKADALGRKLLVDGEEVEPSASYPQMKRFKLYLKEYLDSEKIVSEWVQSSQQENGVTPDIEAIKSYRDETRKGRISRLRRRLGWITHTQQNNSKKTLFLNQKKTP